MHRTKEAEPHELHCEYKKGIIIMGRIIAVANQKGGVGKTTTSINLSSCLAAHGKKVLSIDMDPQGNMTSGLGIDKNSVEYTIYDLILGQAGIEDVICKDAIENLDVLPANVDLSAAEIELIGVENKEFIVHEEVEKVRDNYDFIIIDCPPSLNTLTINAMTTADTVLVPIQCEYYALEGLSQLITTVKRIKMGFNPDLYLEGVLLTMFDGRLNLTQQVVGEIKKYFPKELYKTTIPRGVRLSEAPSYGKPIQYYDNRCKGADAYNDLAKEFIKRNNKK